MSDLIKREDVIVIINKWFDFIKLNPDILIDSIKSIPTAEPLVTVKAKQNEGLYLDTDEDTLLETEYIVVATDGMYKEYIHETDGKPRVGKWLDGERVGYNGTYYYRYCSECLFERNDDDVDKDTPYCPNCGAKMERSE